MTCFASTGRRRSRSKVRSDARGAGLRFLNAGDAHQSCVDVTLRLDQSGALLGGWIPMVAADDRRGEARRAGRTRTTRPRGKAQRRRAPSSGAFMGGTHHEPDFSFPAFFSPFSRTVDTQAWEGSATAGAVVRRVHGGDPSRTRLFLSSLLQSIFSTGRNAGVRRLCDGGRRRQARSWGGAITNPTFPFRPSSVHFLHRSTRRRGKTLRRRAPSSGAFMGGPITNPTFPFEPSSVHFLHRSKRRRGKTLRRRAPSSGAFMGDPSRTRFPLPTFFSPSSRRCQGRQDPRASTTSCDP